MSLTELTEYKCESCGWTFDLNIYGWKGLPNNCPCCGDLWKVKKTPTEIVEKIKSICQRYYPTFMSSCQDKEEMTKLLNELKEMAEANRK